MEAEGTVETVAVDSGDQVIETTEAAESIPSDEMPVEGEAVEPAAGEEATEETQITEAAVADTEVT